MLVFWLAMHFSQPRGIPNPNVMYTLIDVNTLYTNRRVVTSECCGFECYIAILPY